MQGSDLTGKTIVVTGASAGIGSAAAAKLATRGAEVAVVGRSPERTSAVAARIGGTAFTADFTRLDDVRMLATRLLDRYDRIDALLNNAGGSWPGRTATVDGNELTFQVNHLAGFLLTNLLRERLEMSRARVVNTSSSDHRFARLRLDRVNAVTGPFNQITAYADTKMANILFTRELARRTAGTGLTTAAVNPGPVLTGAWDNGPYKMGAIVRSRPVRKLLLGPERGADPLVYLAADAGWINGAYFERHVPWRSFRKQAVDLELAAQLWAYSEELTGLDSRCAVAAD
ncbi:SDR family NAD(P)-dependent oxidoreductase [Nocardia ignorata]|uniref:Short-subunit dehydrogenase n=1 Tax=Nocardia ignorata TaxID=145285 RepID=A0A4R6PIM8_NOCIG|nr:SDR family NAD(P)-dependent oxidoreductase [Nocardia ignorata]TDP37705.1 short-subunit dehydrogenase [Nocardia ignorata]